MRKHLFVLSCLILFVLCSCGTTGYSSDVSSLGKQTTQNSRDASTSSTSETTASAAPASNTTASTTPASNTTASTAPASNTTASTTPASNTTASTTSTQKKDSESITVYFQPNNGSSIITQTVTKNSTAAAPSISRAGYTLKGWYDEGGNRVDDSYGRIKHGDKSATYHAEWEIISSSNSSNNSSNTSSTTSKTTNTSSSSSSSANSGTTTNTTQSISSAASGTKTSASTTSTKTSTGSEETKASPSNESSQTSVPTGPVSSLLVVLIIALIVLAIFPLVFSIKFKFSHGVFPVSWIGFLIQLAVFVGFIFEIVDETSNYDTLMGIAMGVGFLIAIVLAISKVSKVGATTGQKIAAAFSQIMFFIYIVLILFKIISRDSRKGSRPPLNGY